MYTCTRGHMYMCTRVHVYTCTCVYLCAYHYQCAYMCTCMSAGSSAACKARGVWWEGREGGVAHTRGDFLPTGHMHLKMNMAIRKSYAHVSMVYPYSFELHVTNSARVCPPLCRGLRHPSAIMYSACAQSVSTPIRLLLNVHLSLQLHVHCSPTPEPMKELIECLIYCTV